MYMNIRIINSYNSINRVNSSKNILKYQSHSFLTISDSKTDLESKYYDSQYSDNVRYKGGSALFRLFSSDSSVC